MLLRAIRSFKPPHRSNIAPSCRSLAASQKKERDDGSVETAKGQEPQPGRRNAQELRSGRRAGGRSGAREFFNAILENNQRVPGGPRRCSSPACRPAERAKSSLRAV